MRNETFVTVNCDMGESFGIYRFGADEELMTFIDVANVACGFHGSDFNHMRNTVRLAKASGVAVGAHPSLPDMQGFGRRAMAMSREELRNCLLYQIGALSAFLKVEDVPLNHIKPHGALYAMAACDPEVAHAIADVADTYPAPIFGLPGTLHETTYRERGHAFVPEFFADLDYDDEGHVIITREHPPVDPALAKRRTVDAVEHRHLVTQSGKSHPINIETICVHSDTPNAVELASVIATTLQRYRQ